jgi:hypothetical protein
MKIIPLLLVWNYNIVNLGYKLQGDIATLDNTSYNSHYHLHRNVKHIPVTGRGGL